MPPILFAFFHNETFLESPFPAKAKLQSFVVLNFSVIDDGNASRGKEGE